MRLQNEQSTRTARLWFVTIAGRRANERPAERARLRAPTAQREAVQFAPASAACAHARRQRSGRQKEGRARWLPADISGNINKRAVNSVGCPAFQWTDRAGSRRLLRGPSVVVGAARVGRRLDCVRRCSGGFGARWGPASARARAAHADLRPEGRSVFRVWRLISMLVHRTISPAGRLAFKQSSGRWQSGRQTVCPSAK